MSQSYERYYLNAFTGDGFKGNPACVTVLHQRIDDSRMQEMASENGLPETGFILPEDGELSLRWFTPDIEMDLCGHCTLAAAHIAFTVLYGRRSSFRNAFPYENEVCFTTAEGKVSVAREEIGRYTLSFPIRKASPSQLPPQIAESLSIKPVETYKSRDYLLIYNSMDEILSLTVKDRVLFDSINLDPGGVAVSAALGNGDRVEGAPGCDFVSRFFTPQATILEDPVTGSAHCTLVPFWAERLSKRKLVAVQLSANRGLLDCTMEEDRVLITGRVI